MGINTTEVSSSLWSRMVFVSLLFADISKYSYISINRVVVVVPGDSKIFEYYFKRTTIEKLKNSKIAHAYTQVTSTTHCNRKIFNPIPYHRPSYRYISTISLYLDLKEVQYIYINI